MKLFNTVSLPELGQYLFKIANIPLQRFSRCSCGVPLFFDGVIVPSSAVDITYLGAKETKLHKQIISASLGVLSPFLKFSRKQWLVYNSKSWSKTYC